jgi:hypothetical protein
MKLIQLQIQAIENSIKILELQFIRGEVPEETYTARLERYGTRLQELTDRLKNLSMILIEN